LRCPLTWLPASGGHVRVLRALLLHGGAQSAAQLAADCAMSARGVRNTLDALFARGVVQVLGPASARLFAPAMDQPLMLTLVLTEDSVDASHQAAETAQPPWPARGRCALARRASKRSATAKRVETRRVISVCSSMVKGPRATQATRRAAGLVRIGAKDGGPAPWPGATAPVQSAAPADLSPTRHA